MSEVNFEKIATQLNQRAELYLKEKKLELAKTTCEQKKSMLMTILI
ncbi:MAG: hypothetical protein MGF17_09985 [Trichodesmium sp. MAG_R04]|nr:hypothetical protein [Trichodesmium sp. MAG_R04]